MACDIRCSCSFSTQREATSSHLQGPSGCTQVGRAHSAEGVSTQQTDARLACLRLALWQAARKLHWRYLQQPQRQHICQQVVF